MLMHFFLSFIMCVFVIVWVSLSLMHSFVVFFFGVFVCVDGMAAAVPFTSFVFVAAAIDWVLRLTFSSGHLSFSLSRYHRSTIYFHLLSHTTAANFSSLSLSCVSFCFNSSSTALTISFIRFVLIDFYGFCYLLLFASLCFLFFFTIFTLLVVVFQFYLRLDFILTSFTFKCSREHFLLS